jgi:hypothetical protein
MEANEKRQPEDENYQDIELPPTSSQINQRQVEPIFCAKDDCGFARTSLTSSSARITGIVSVADWAIKYWTKGVISKFVSMRLPESGAMNSEVLRTAPYLMSVHAMPTANPTNKSDIHRFFFSERSPDGNKRSLIELSLTLETMPSKIQEMAGQRSVCLCGS